MKYKGRTKEKIRKEDVEMVKNYKAFDVVLVNFGSAEFFGEQAGVRPAVIVQNFVGNVHSPCTIVLPMTTKIKHLTQPTHSFFGKDSEKA